MKKIFILLTLVAVTSMANGVNVYTETFDNPSTFQWLNEFGTADIADGKCTLNADGGINDIILRTIGQGSFVADIDFSSILLGTNYSFGYRVYHSGASDTSNLLSVLAKQASSGVVTWYLDMFINGVRNRVSYNVSGPLTSADVEVQWEDTTGTFTVFIGDNGLPLTQKASWTGLLTSVSTRCERLYVGSSGGSATAPVVQIDNYSMIPEPASMTMLVFGFGLLFRKRK